MLLIAKLFLTKQEAGFSKAITINKNALPFVAARQTSLVCWRVALNLEEYRVIVMCRCKR